MSIKIGDKNKIKGSSIGHQYGTTDGNKELDKKKTFTEKHPIMISFSVSLIAGFILLFSTWGKIVAWLESFFK